MNHTDLANIISEGVRQAMENTETMNMVQGNEKNFHDELQEMREMMEQLKTENKALLSKENNRQPFQNLANFQGYYQPPIPQYQQGKPPYNQSNYNSFWQRSRNGNNGNGNNCWNNNNSRNQNNSNNGGSWRNNNNNGVCGVTTTTTTGEDADVYPAPTVGHMVCVPTIVWTAGPPWTDTARMWP